jgi:N-acetylglucosamine malate deacetylase 1
MKLDLLVFAAHPDDAELSCSGTILSFTSKGRKVGIVDLTEGELGTRGTVEDRRAEAADSARILGLSARENAGLPDGFFSEDNDALLKVIYFIRKYQPEIIICNAVLDRHPDHGNGGALVSRACFLSGLRKIETSDNGENQEVWRPLNLYHYIQDRYLKPDFIVDVTPYWERKVQSVKAFKTQFYDPSSNEPVTYISNPDFLDFIEARARGFGHDIGVKYGEGFTTDRNRMVGIKDLSDLI